MRIISLNLNGIRSAAKKGCFTWLAAQKADILCVQELKAQAADMTEEFLAPGGHTGYFHYAEKKGYSGAGVYTRHKPTKTHIGFGSKEFDAEGRYVRVDFDKFSAISIYLPSGSSSPERQAAKFRFLADFLPHLHKLRKSGREFVICGDWNIAHKEIDLRNWRSNRKNSGFLPEERTWITHVFDEIGFVDVFRRLNNRPDQYT
jgi:exodeoxyribonuclease-3